MTKLDPEHVDERMNGLLQLLEITRSLADQHDLDNILRCVADGACKALSCERASLFLYDADKQELYTRIATALEIEEIRTSIDAGIAGWVARRRRVANIPHPETDARWNSAIDRKTGFKSRNIIAVPVMSPRDDRLVGVLQLLNKNGGSFDEFDEQLLQAFAAHAATALERAALLEEIRHAETLRVSVEVGRSIQKSFLPDRIPEIEGYDIGAFWQAAEFVSGDYYDVIPLPDGRLGLVVADVSGHGVGASLVMASIRAMLHVLACSVSDPAEIVRRLTLTISNDLPSGMFVTLFVAALDSRTHELTYANAGHAPVLHFVHNSPDGSNLGAVRSCGSLSATGLPVGVSTDFGYPANQTCRLGSGDILLLATDGAIELRNGSNEMFGRARLERLVIENSDVPADELIGGLSRSILNFGPHADLPDDVTLLVVKRN